ncbi:hypothetical protein [Leptolyngbya sp. FACHB-261]|uniref:hypothetical protein n=1 Tax=Leptolyngbya sp. FACHB-261 TaxID=2692806 RepID=UPI0016861EEA|nr:hypothetical protein [Leptolyngbya sp. FACHB-261]MBD2100908.1 hypothetical protein [Leptolyngbya sp. FACHB-261]
MLSASLSMPLFAACGGPSTSTPPPPVDDTQSGQVAPAPNAPPQQRAKKGLNTTQKVAILAGAAALYYLYNRQKNAQGQGPEGQYYLSKNGRVYYRDAQNRAHWVTPPPGGIRVPESEARAYEDFEGYNNRSTGRDLTDVVGAPAQ